MKKSTAWSGLLWSAAVLASMPLLAGALLRLIVYPWSAPLSATDPLRFTPKQLDVALETVKMLLPICTGYVLFAAPALKYLREQRQLRRTAVRIGVVMVFSLGIAAIAVWTGTLAYLGNCANAFEQPEHNFLAIGPAAWQNRSWSLALLCAQVAHLLFFASIVWFAATATDILFLSPDEPDANLNAPGQKGPVPPNDSHDAPPP